MCRTDSIPVVAARPPPSVERTVVPAPSAALPAAASSTRSRVSDYAEREHAERQARRSRQLQLERRLDGYAASVWTPSGRPYESLPVVSLGEMREVLKQNTRSLATSMSERDTPSLFREPPHPTRAATARR